MPSIIEPNMEHEFLSDYYKMIAPIFDATVNKIGYKLRINKH